MLLILVATCHVPVGNIKSANEALVQGLQEGDNSERQPAGCPKHGSRVVRATASRVGRKGAPASLRSGHSPTVHRGLPLGFGQ